jgi:hypothetical protein
MNTSDRDDNDEDTYQTDFPGDRIAAEGRDDTEPRDIELVTVLESGDTAVIAVAESLLDGAEIPYLARGEMIQDLFGLGRLTAVNPITGPVVIQVDRADLADAQLLLADLLTGGEGDGDTEDESDDEFEG